MRLVALVLVVSVLNFLTACYSHHAIGKDDLSLIQQGALAQAGLSGGDVAGDEGEVDEGQPVGVRVSSLAGEEVLVTPDTWVYLTDMDGIRHPVQAYGFRVTESQLLAPEQGLVLGLGWIENAEISQVSVPKTLLAVGAGVAAAAAVTLTIIATAGEDTGYGN